MTADPTFPKPSISQQGAPARLLISLVQEFGALPSAYITMHTPFEDLPVCLNLQLDTPHAFETWRAALAIPPNDVDLHATSGLKWLSARTVYQDVPLYLSVMHVPLTDAQAGAPRDRDEVAA